MTLVDQLQDAAKRIGELAEQDDRGWYGNRRALEDVQENLLALIFTVQGKVLVKPVVHQSSIKNGEWVSTLPVYSYIPEGLGYSPEESLIILQSIHDHLDKYPE